MRMTIITALGALSMLAGAALAQTYQAEDLLKACTEADNDARWGETAELECEQYMMGFVDALREAGDKTICPPNVNTADEVRWAYMRWFHQDYSAHKKLTAGAALLATLQDKFKCKQ